MSSRRGACLALVFSAMCRTAAAQTPQGLVFRPFVAASVQQFIAQETFEAAFGRASQTFFGGGLSITENDEAYLDLTASRFKKTGQQAFLNDGQIFRLGIPMTVEITPFEITAGYRFHPASKQPRPLTKGANRLTLFIPYVGGGVGFYQYKQTSAFATDEENVDTQHAGAIAEGGVEIRVHRLIGIAMDVHYTYVPGILGEGGISKLAGESDLGGIAARIKIVVGR